MKTCRPGKGGGEEPALYYTRQRRNFRIEGEVWFMPQKSAHSPCRDGGESYFVICPLRGVLSTKKGRGGGTFRPRQKKKNVRFMGVGRREKRRSCSRKGHFLNIKREKKRKSPHHEKQ